MLGITVLESSSLLEVSPCLTGTQYLCILLHYRQLSDWEIIAWIKVLKSCTESIEP